MAQFSTQFPVLLSILFLLNPLSCVCSRIYNIRDMQKRDIPTNAPDTRQYESSQEEPTYQTNHRSDKTRDELISEIFQVGFPPGLTIFNNTSPFEVDDSQSSSSYSSYTQPITEAPFRALKDSTGKLTGVPSKELQTFPNDNTAKATSSSSYPLWSQPITEAPTFKVSRDPNGKLTAVPSKELQTFPKGNLYSDRSHDDSHYSHPVQKDEQKNLDMNYVISSDDCVEGKATFCTDVRNYPPETVVEEILKKNFINLNIFFGEDTISPDDFSQRMNNEPNVESLCESRTTLITPQAGWNIESNWTLIVNTDKYKQAIQIEECINEGSVCGPKQKIDPPPGYNITCKQSYIYRSLVSIADGKVLPNSFKFPSCCKCVMKPLKNY
ncbi:protein spaetzle isoform X1 [Musca domestica]|uniref:Protein spaetzle isoform X1 n=1 Tax=Musca domestica TaxID=7370 RepID=A0ABM3VA84_MUSDO|nr:protein spaetzle isoform X1 [Musca domestica]